MYRYIHQQLIILKTLRDVQFNIALLASALSIGSGKIHRRIKKHAYILSATENSSWVAQFIILHAGKSTGNKIGPGSMPDKGNNIIVLGFQKLQGVTRRLAVWSASGRAENLAHHHTGYGHQAQGNAHT
jgi:hypothetical protein